MGTTNFGNQTLSFDYNQDATGKLFNLLNYNIIPSGIYTGFALTKLSNILVSISSGICFIYDDINKVAVRVETSSDQNISVSNATPYIVFRMQWADATNCFMDMLAVSFADIETSDIIVGRCVYDNAGTILNTSFDYTRKTVFYLSKIKQQDSYLRVTPTEPVSNQIMVSSANLNSSKGNLSVAGGTFPVAGISNTVNGRIDIIYVDENGAIQITEGVDSISPVAPRYGNKKVVAEIRRGATRTDINGTEIVQVNTTLDVPPITSDQLIVDAGSLYSSDNVEGALQEIAGSAFTFKGVKTLQGQLDITATTGNVALKAKGIAGQNIEELRKADNTLVQRIDTNGKLINSIGCQIAITDAGNVFTTDEIEAAINQLGNSAITLHGTKTFDSQVKATAGIETTAITASGTSTFNVINATTVNTTSCLAKKENIKLYNGDALEIIKKTKIVEYSYIDDPIHQIHRGFIADFTAKELSGPNNDQMLLSDSIGVIMKAIQQLSEKIDVLQSE